MWKEKGKKKHLPPLIIVGGKRQEYHEKSKTTLETNYGEFAEQ